MDTSVDPVGHGRPRASKGALTLISCSTLQSGECLIGSEPYFSDIFSARHPGKKVSVFLGVVITALRHADERLHFGTGEQLGLRLRGAG